MEGFKVKGLIENVRAGKKWGFRFTMVYKAAPRMQLQATLWADTPAELQQKFDTLIGNRPARVRPREGIKALIAEK